MTYKAYRKGFMVIEVPIIFIERDLGKSKISWAIIWESIWGVLKLRLNHPLRHRAHSERRVRRNGAVAIHGSRVRSAAGNVIDRSEEAELIGAGGGRHVAAPAAGSDVYNGERS